MIVAVNRTLDNNPEGMTEFFFTLSGFVILYDPSL